MNSWFLLLAPLIGLVSLVVCSVLVYRGQNQMAVASLILAANLPILCGLFAYCSGTVAMYEAKQTFESIETNLLAAQISRNINAFRVGLLASVPAYSVALVGSLVRSFRSNADEIFDELSS